MLGLYLSGFGEIEAGLKGLHTPLRLPYVRFFVKILTGPCGALLLSEVGSVILLHR